MTWKETLSNAVPPALATEIETFENQIALKKQGKLDDKLFAETRLRRGAYGQRYDNGRRQDGIAEQELAFPSHGITKGPDTLWDAPGMQRIKIPFGGLTSAQMRVLADLAEEYSDAVCHVTTRQDIQLHYIHLEDTPAMAWRLAAVGITTREACGNSVRNVTACPRAGVCPDETFDVTPYAQATARFLMGHPDTQDFGRKFKYAFSGCGGHACGLVSMHDLGAIAKTRTVDGVEQRGFETYVGGGLGAVPYAAQLFDEFVPEEEFLPLTQAISRVFARLGEKKQRARARIKFLIADLGIDEFRRLVTEERARLTPDERWTTHLAGAREENERPLRTGLPLNSGARPDGFNQWQQANVAPQRQGGYSIVTIALPLGDLTSRQMRDLADIADTYVGDTVRLTVEQNIVLRWVSNADLPALYSALAAIGLAEAGASTIADITACPGTDTCKLGIASSRGLAAELRARLADVVDVGDAAVRRLHIKISGCFNSCAQHHVADVGFYGVSRNIGKYQVPHFQVVLGGQWDQNAGAYGLAIGAVPSKNVPAVLKRILDRYVQDRTEGERFQQFVDRVGKRALKESFADLARVPSFEQDPEFYTDWGDPRVFTLADMGVGECAGEVVDVGAFELSVAEAQVFEAQMQLHEQDFVRADALAYQAMLGAARGLVKQERIDVSEDPDEIVREFRTRFHDTALFHDKYAGGKFAQYLFQRHAKTPQATANSARRMVEEAQLFLEAAHACVAKLAVRPLPLSVDAGVART